MKHREKRDVKMKLMRYKIRDAYKSYKEAVIADKTCWKENKIKIPADIRDEYSEIWKETVKAFKQKIDDEYKKRHEWLCKKWIPKEEQLPDTLREIILEDQELTSEFTSDPRIYGHADVNDDELKVLSLPPDYGLYKGPVTR